MQSKHKVVSGGAKPAQKARNREAMFRYAGGAIIALVIIYIIYAALQSPITTITSTKSIPMAVNQTIFIRIFNGSTDALMLQAATNSSATVYVTQLPILYNPVSAVILTAGSSANVSKNATPNADMNIRVTSTNKNGATIVVTPLSGLGVRTSGNVAILQPASFSAILSKGTNGATTTIATTTGSSTSSASTTSTSSVTTSTNSTAALYQQALVDMNQTTVGSLLKKFKALYNKVPNCTSTGYNTTYIMAFSTKPPASLSYANLTPYTPTDLKITESSLPAKNNVLITYSTVSPSSATSGPAVLAAINTSAVAYLVNFNFTGSVYYHFNLSKLNSTYQIQSKYSGSCGAFMTH